MWRQFRRKRDRRREAIEQALSVLEGTQALLRMSRAEHRRRAYGHAMRRGIGIVLMLLLISLSFWLLRRRARETAPSASLAEEGDEEGTLPVTEVVVVENEEITPPVTEVVPDEMAQAAEYVPPREEPPPGEERPERRGAAPTTPPPPPPREEPPPGEERPEGRTP